jgi:hypothetical protein
VGEKGQTLFTHANARTRTRAAAPPVPPPIGGGRLAGWRPARASRPARPARCTSAARSRRSRTGGAATGCCCGSTTRTRPARSPAPSDAIVEDLRWLGVDWDEGPLRQSTRADRHRAAAAALAGAEHDDNGALLFAGRTMLRADGSPTYQLASVVDDVDFRITHVVRGGDHRDNEAFQRQLFAALGAAPPEFVHHGLVLGPEGTKLSKREHPETTVAALRAAGFPAEAVRAYLDELGEPRHDVHYDPARSAASRSTRSTGSPTTSWRRASARRSSWRGRSAARATSWRRARWRARSRRRSQSTWATTPARRWRGSSS